MHLSRFLLPQRELNDWLMEAKIHEFEQLLDALDEKSDAASAATEAPTT